MALVGSSLGAFVALHAAARMAGRGNGPVDRLVLLAPALDLVPGLEEEFGPARMAAWEDSGRCRSSTTATTRCASSGGTFMPDARRYDSVGGADHLPTLIYQGRRDEVVACRRRRAVGGLAARTSPCDLVDDGHQLLGAPRDDVGRRRDVSRGA